VGDDSGVSLSKGFGDGVSPGVGETSSGTYSLGVKMTYTHFSTWSFCVSKAPESHKPYVTHLCTCRAQAAGLFGKTLVTYISNRS
jgi:hypothetical protein